MDRDPKLAAPALAKVPLALRSLAFCVARHMKKPKLGKKRRERKEPCSVLITIATPITRLVVTSIKDRKGAATTVACRVDMEPPKNPGSERTRKRAHREAVGRAIV